PVTLSVDPSISLTISVSGADLNLTCSPYPDDAAPTGITDSAPPGSPISPVVATANGATTSTTSEPATTSTVPASTGGTSPYELYCPGTPVGNIVLNDVATDGTIAPPAPAPGQAFELTGFQSVVDLPGSIVSAAAALGNAAITGTAVLKVDATGATPASVSGGSLPIDTPIPNPVPAEGLMLELPATPGTVGPFTATGGPVTLSVDPSISLTISVSGANLNLVCKTYPNDTAPTGIASSPPPGALASPVIATANGTTPSSTTTEPGTTTTIPATTSGTAPYELSCPGTPVGDIVINGVVTQGTISPASPAPGQSFDLTGFQTVLTLPSSIVSAAAALGNSTITGTAVVQVDATGATPASLSGGSLPIDAPIPMPVPRAGLTLKLPAAPGTVGPFTASGGVITLTVGGSVRVTLVVSGSALDLTCAIYPNNTAPSGITASGPTGKPASPVIASARPGTPSTTSTSTTTSSTTTSSTTSTTTVSTTSTTALSATSTTAPTAGGSSTTTSVPPGPPLTLSTGSAPIAPGTTVTLSGAGFAAGEHVDLALFSTAVALGSTVADGDGDVTAAVTIPASTPSGAHTITATGVTSGVVDSVSITVSSAAGTSTTAAPTTTSSATRPASVTTTPAALAPAVPSSALAFTGPGSALRWLALAGALLVVLAGALFLGMAARRAVLLVAAPGASLPDSLRRRVGAAGTRCARQARRSGDWLLGRGR
ncbi:MAG TPA: hypothetical protein VLZ77_01365, partial [Acidimicrobiales bacterium]|nr:hypothetical protein [Acidimicrobiales bacterium]